MPDDDAADKLTDPNAGGANNPVAGGDGQTPQDKLEFSKAQQEFLQRHTDEVFGRGYKKAESHLEPKLAEANARVEAANARIEAVTKELADLKKAQTPPKSPDDDGKNKKQEPPVKDEAMAQENQRLKATIEELNTGIKTLSKEKEDAVGKLTTFETTRRDARIKDEFLAAMPTGVTFFSPLEIFELVRKSIDVDEAGRIVIMNPKTGTPRLGSDYQSPMTIAEFIAEYAEKHPWEVKANNAEGGTGGGEARRQEKPKEPAPPKVKDMPAKEFEAFLQKVKSGHA
jgi:prefoldin subunit 5